MNPHAIIAACLLCVSEILPYTPLKGNGIVQASFQMLHAIKLVPDAQYERIRAEKDTAAVLPTTTLDTTPTDATSTSTVVEGACFDITIRRARKNRLRIEM